MTALHALTAGELLAGYRAGRFSPLEVAQAVVAQVERWEPHIHATWGFDAQAVLAQARDSVARWQRGEAAGALDGVPVTLKTRRMRSRKAWNRDESGAGMSSDHSDRPAAPADEPATPQIPSPAGPQPAAPSSHPPHRRIRSGRPRLPREVLAASRASSEAMAETPSAAEPTEPPVPPPPLPLEYPIDEDSATGIEPAVIVATSTDSEPAAPVEPAIAEALGEPVAEFAEGVTEREPVSSGSATPEPDVEAALESLAAPAIPEEIAPPGEPEAVIESSAAPDQPLVSAEPVAAIETVLNPPESDEETAPTTPKIDPENPAAT